MKRKMGKYWFLLALVMVGVVVALATQPSLLFAITGSYDSDLLFLSGTPTVLEGQNQPLVGDVVVANFIVGIGNDVAFVGSYDKESVSVSAPGSGTANYFVTAKKVKSNTSVPLTGQKRLLRNSGFTQSGTKNGYSLGTLIQSHADVEESLKYAAQQAYLMMKSELGSNLLAFGWRPVEQSDFPTGTIYSYHSICTSYVAGFCTSGWTPQVYWVAYEFGSGSIEYQGFGAKQANVQVDVELTNSSGEGTGTLILAQGNCGSNCRTEGYLYEGGEAVGFAKLTGLQPSYQLPLDLADEAPALVGSTQYLVSKNVADAGWEKLLSLDLFSQSFSTWTGNIVSIESAVNEYKSFYVSTYNSRSSLFSDKWSFSYDAASNSYVVNDSYTTNPTLQVVVKGDWIGLIRDVAEFDLACGGSVEGFEGASLYSSVSVTNTSTVKGNYSLSWNCPTGSNSIQTTLSAGSSQSHNVSLYLNRVETGTCSISLNYGDTVKTCGIGYSFKAVPEPCGNGRVDPGENCENCFTDVRCGANELCINKVCTVTNSCGNGVVDIGENCDNCARDLEAVNGSGFCSVPEPEMDYLVVLVIAVLAVLAIVAVLYWRRLGPFKKKRGRGRKR